MKKTYPRSRRFFTIALLALPVAAQAESGDAGLAQDLTNPLANLVTVPIQMNLDQDIGPQDEGTKVTTNAQPVFIWCSLTGWRASLPAGSRVQVADLVPVGRSEDSVTTADRRLQP